jgi:hypothetical protein
MASNWWEQPHQRLHRGTVHAPGKKIWEAEYQNGTTTEGWISPVLWGGTEAATGKEDGGNNFGGPAWWGIPEGHTAWRKYRWDGAGGWLTERGAPVTTRRCSGESDGGPTAPRVALWLWATLGPAHGGWEVVREAIHSEWRWPRWGSSGDAYWGDEGWCGWSNRLRLIEGLLRDLHTKRYRGQHESSTVILGGENQGCNRSNHWWRKVTYQGGAMDIWQSLK